MESIVGRIFSQGEDDVEEPTEEEIAAARKSFHRDHVRNGPVTPRVLSNGQLRRQEERAANSASRKANRLNRKRWAAQQRDLAYLRGHLMAVGVLPGSAGVPFGGLLPETVQQHVDILQERYGSVEQALAIYQKEVGA